MTNPISKGIQHAAHAAKDKLMHVVASGIVATDPLTDEEEALLREASQMTPEQSEALAAEVGNDPFWGTR